MTQYEILTDYKTFKFFYDAKEHLRNGILFIGIPLSYFNEKGFSTATYGDVEYDYITSVHPDLTADFLNKFDDALCDNSTKRIDNNIKFESEEEYIKDDFEFIKDVFKDELEHLESIFIVGQLREIAARFKGIKIKYAYDKSTDYHIVEISPEEIRRGNEKYMNIEKNLYMCFTDKFPNSCILINKPCDACDMSNLIYSNYDTNE